MSRVRGIMLVAAAHLAVVSTPALALAQTAQTGPTAQDGTRSERSTIGRTPLDVVYLKSGGLFRGTIVDAVPNVRARLQLITGEIATIPWAEIDHIDRGGSPAPSSPASVDRTAAAGPQDVVWLHVDADSDDARVQEDTTGDDEWVTVCAAPCDKALSTAHSYRIVGESIRRSAEFTLHEEGGSHQSIRVQSASRSAFTWGLVGAIAGGSVAYVGFALLVLGAETKSGDIHLTANPDSLIEAGGVAVGAGLLVGIAGLVSAVNNAKSKVIRSGQAADSPNALLRLPPTEGAHGNEAAAERAAFPQAVSIPLFRGRF